MCQGKPTLHLWMVYGWWSGEIYNLNIVIPSDGTRRGNHPMFEEE
jgi:hypothetical protein